MCFFHVSNLSFVWFSLPVNEERDDEEELNNEEIGKENILSEKISIASNKPTHTKINQVHTIRYSIQGYFKWPACYKFVMLLHPIFFRLRKINLQSFKKKFPIRESRGKNGSVSARKILHYFVKTIVKKSPKFQEEISHKIS